MSTHSLTGVIMSRLQTSSPDPDSWVQPTAGAPTLSSSTLTINSSVWGLNKGKGLLEKDPILSFFLYLMMQRDDGIDGGVSYMFLDIRLPP